MQNLIQLMNKAISKSDFLEVEAAVWNLGDLGAIQAVKPLLELLEHAKKLCPNNHYVREAIVCTLGRIGSFDAVEILTTTLKADPHWLVRQSAAIALGQIKDDSSLDDLKDALLDQYEVRMAAFEAIKLIQMSSTTKHIKSKVNDLLVCSA